MMYVIEPGAVAHAGGVIDRRVCCPNLNDTSVTHHIAGYVTERHGFTGSRDQDLTPFRYSRIARACGVRQCVILATI